MKRRWIALACCILAILMVIPLSLGCGKKAETETKTIVIGDLTDLTGPAAAAMTPISWSLVDYCNYINTEGLIPNVKLTVVQYDTKYDTSRFSLGYESVKAQGASVIWTGFPGVAESLNTRAGIDGIPIICASSTVALVDNPGAVFCLAALMRGVVPAELNWIYQNDWKKTGPATIGMASWNVPPDPDIETAVKKYCQDNPGQFTLVGTSMVPAGTMTWSAEVAQYKNCDYLWFGSGGSVAPTTFISQYRAAGGTAKILAGDQLVSYIGSIADKAGWPAIDEMYNGVNWGWWTYDSDQVRLAIQLLQQNHTAAEANAMINRQALSGIIDAEVAVELIRAVVDKIGTKDLSSKAIMDGLQEVSVTLPGFPTLDYSGGSREGLRYIMMWKGSAADQNLVKASDWVPLPE